MNYSKIISFATLFVSINSLGFTSEFPEQTENSNNLLPPYGFQDQFSQKVNSVTEMIVGHPLPEEGLKPKLVPKRSVLGKVLFKVYTPEGETIMIEASNPTSSEGTYNLGGQKTFTVTWNEERTIISDTSPSKMLKGRIVPINPELEEEKCLSEKMGDCSTVVNVLNNKILDKMNGDVFGILLNIVNIIQKNEDLLKILSKNSHETRLTCRLFFTDVEQFSKQYKSLEAQLLKLTSHIAEQGEQISKMGNKIKELEKKIEKRQKIYINHCCQKN